MSIQYHKCRYTFTDTLLISSNMFYHQISGSQPMVQDPTSGHKIN